jgi:hypothetical protein
MELSYFEQLIKSIKSAYNIRKKRRAHVEALNKTSSEIEEIIKKKMYNL